MREAPRTLRLRSQGCLWQENANRGTRLLCERVSESHDLFLPPRPFPLQLAHAQQSSAITAGDARSCGVPGCRVLSCREPPIASCWFLKLGDQVSFTCTGHVLRGCRASSATQLHTRTLCWACHGSELRAFECVLDVTTASADDCICAVRCRDGPVQGACCVCSRATPTHSTHTFSP